MKSVKWMIVMSIIAIACVTVQTTTYSLTSVKNQCNQATLGTKPPQAAADCNLPDPDDGTCCFVSVTMPDGKLNYCAFIPGAYVKEKAIEDFKHNLVPLNSEVICSSGYKMTLSLLFLFFILSLIL